MSEHDVARDQMTNGHKTPANFGATSGVDLMYVRHGAVVNTISLSAVAADDVEISFGVELGVLLGRQPVSKQAQAASLTVIFTREYPAQPAQDSSTQALPATGEQKHDGEAYQPPTSRGKNNVLLRLDRTTELG